MGLLVAAANALGRRLIKIARGIVPQDEGGDGGGPGGRGRPPLVEGRS